MIDFGFGTTLFNWYRLLFLAQPDKKSIKKAVKKAIDNRFLDIASNVRLFNFYKKRLNRILTFVPEFWFDPITRILILEPIWV